MRTTPENAPPRRPAPRRRRLRASTIILLSLFGLLSMAAIGEALLPMPAASDRR
jgi:hypothetical protein